MKLPCFVATALVALAVAAPFQAQEKKLPQNNDGFVPMFNGKDLTGWVNVNCAPGTFFVKDDMIITTGKPTGYLRTERQYENFIAEFEWMHIPPKPGEVGNSGFFVWCDALPAVGTGYTRGIEVQVLVNLEWKDKKTGASTATSHGDLFSIHGAKCVPERPHPLGWERCLPSENRAKGQNEWNHYRVEANDGTIKLAVNGKVVSSVSKCMPRKGYLALESEGSECRFRNLKIKELPSTYPKKEEIATEGKGHKSLFDGLTFDGWTTGEKDAIKAWSARDGVLTIKKEIIALGMTLKTSQQFGDCEFAVDYRLPKQNKVKGTTWAYTNLLDRGLTIVASSEGRLVIRGADEREMALQAEPDLKSDGWNRVQTTIQKDRLTVLVNGKAVMENQGVQKLVPKGSIALGGSTTAEFRNLFIRELK